jgi:hypothetical protein
MAGQMVCVHLLMTVMRRASTAATTNAERTRYFIVGFGRKNKLKRVDRKEIKCEGQAALEEVEGEESRMWIRLTLASFYTHGGRLSLFGP